MKREMLRSLTKIKEIHIRVHKMQFQEKLSGIYNDIHKPFLLPYVTNIIPLSE